MFLSLTSSHLHTWASLLDLTFLPFYFDLTFPVLFHSSVLMHPEPHTDLDNLNTVQHNLRNSAKGSNDAYDVTVSLTSSEQEILYLGTFQGHSGRNLIDPSLQDNVLIPDDFFEYIYHVGCAINLHSIINSGLIPGGQNLSKRHANSTPHRSHFLVDSHLMTRNCVAQVQVWRAQRTFHIISCVISMRSRCVFDSPRLLHFPLLAVHLLSYLPVFLPGHQLLLPRCGGQIPCALQLMRTLAPLPSTTLSQVMSPTTATSRRPVHPGIHQRERSLNDLEYDDYTIGMALSSPLFTQEREDDASRRRAYHSRDEGLSSSQSSSVGHRTGRPVVEQFDSWISNVREIPRSSSENEQVRILLERQREQILVDCRAEIQKHDFQADCDRRSIQKLNEVIESQRGKIYRDHQGDEQLDEINNFFMNNYWHKIGIFVKLMRKVSMRWKNWSEFKALHSIQFRWENWSKIETLSLNSQARFRNYRMKLIVWLIREIFKMLNQYAVDNPTLTVNQCVSHLTQILVECQAVLWECRAAKMGRQTFGTRMVYRETFLKIQQRLLQHFIRKSRILMYPNTHHHMWWVKAKHQFRIRDASQDRQLEIQSSLVREDLELWNRPTTTADFRSSSWQIHHASNIRLLEDKIQDWGMYLFTISYGSYAVDQRSGVGWFSRWSKIFVLCKMISNAKFWSTRCEDRFGTEQNHP